MFDRRDDISCFNEDVESIFTEIRNPNKCHNIILCVVYHPPNGSPLLFNDYLYRALNKVPSEVKYRFLMGDFNVDLCKPDSADFLNNLSSCGFSLQFEKQMITVNINNGEILIALFFFKITMAFFS